MDYHLPDEGAAALGGADAATGAPRLERLCRLDLGQCVRLSGRGLGGLPPGLQELRLGHCVNLKVPPPRSPAPAVPRAPRAEWRACLAAPRGGPASPWRRPRVQARLGCAAVEEQGVAGRGGYWPCPRAPELLLVMPGCVALHDPHPHCAGRDGLASADAAQALPQPRRGALRGRTRAWRRSARR